MHQYIVGYPVNESNIFLFCLCFDKKIDLLDRYEEKHLIINEFGYGSRGQEAFEGILPLHL